MSAESQGQMTDRVLTPETGLIACDVFDAIPRLVMIGTSRRTPVKSQRCGLLPQEDTVFASRSARDLRQVLEQQLPKGKRLRREKRAERIARRPGDRRVHRRASDRA